MGEEEKNPNPMIDLVPDLLEEIFLRLPLKSILKFKTVSKQWRSIVLSRSFAERRRKLINKIEKNPQILVAARRFKANEKEIEIVCLDCDAASTRPSLSCDGLVCIPVPGSVNVLNPFTGEFLRFPSGPDPVKPRSYDSIPINDTLWDVFPGYWSMGFGKDKVNGSYKVVRMFFETKQFEILDINIGEWRKLSNPAPYYVEFRRKSAHVNGSIYWHDYMSTKLLALDLHTEEFRDVPSPVTYPMPIQLVNLEGRLAISSVGNSPTHLFLEIWSFDEEEETWSQTYEIRLCSKADNPRVPLRAWWWCKPLVVSKEGNLFFYDNQKRFYKYCPEID